MNRLYSAVAECLVSSAFLVLASCAFCQEPYYIHKDRVTAEQKVQMDKLFPSKAFATPKKSRKLLVFDVNASYGGHGAITYANYALEQMGKRTGAFVVERVNDRTVFQWDRLKQYDAIFINNVVGAPFTEQEYFDNIVRFVKEGGGLMGVHGTTAAFIDWAKDGSHKDYFPEFGRMIGGRSANHRAMDEVVHVKVEDAKHPLTAMFPAEGFSWTDEFFRFRTDDYSRKTLRVLLSIDTAKTNLNDGRHKPERADDDYGIAWIRHYGQGRVFYCSLAHNPKVFFEPDFLKFYLAATQYVLGDFDVPDEPVAR